MSRGSVLIVDDEKNIVLVLAAILEKRGLRVTMFTDPRQALAELRSRTFDAAVTDLFMPELGGIEFLQEAKRIQQDLPVVVITAFGAVETAVDAMRNGAFDYVTKPFEQSEIVAVVEKAVSERRLNLLELIPGGQAPVSTEQTPIVPRLLASQAAPLAELSDFIHRVASLSVNVLLRGERGVGKNLIAEAIHQRSDRASEALVRLNCATIPPAQLDHELFGAGDRAGRLELGRKGTLYLDEIDLLPLPTQARLAECLELGWFERSSDGTKIPLELRLVSSTTKDLQLESEEGRFAPELYYALSVARFEIPALRQRMQDFPQITEALLERIAQKFGTRKLWVSETCLQELCKQRWPGNLRQLETTLERMALLATENGEISETAIPEDLQHSVTEIDLGVERLREIVKRKTQDIERNLIESALRSTGDNVTRAAEQLGLSRKGLQLKLRELGIR